MSSDRYEGRPSGHGFGATYSGLTNDNRPVLALLLPDWEEYPAALVRIKAALDGRSGQSVSACIRSLVRHGYAEQQPARLGVAARIRRAEAAK